MTDPIFEFLMRNFGPEDEEFEDDVNITDDE